MNRVYSTLTVCPESFLSPYRRPNRPDPSQGKGSRANPPMHFSVLLQIPWYDWVLPSRQGARRPLREEFMHRGSERQGPNLNFPGKSQNENPVFARVFSDAPSRENDPLLKSPFTPHP